MLDQPKIVHPPQPTAGRLREQWEKPLKDLVLVEHPSLSEEEKERHGLYSHLLMALVAHYWNGNKRGREGEYPWREGQKGPDGRYLGGDYLGHNIASIAVDAEGEIIDFDFNHNEILSSSVEHAESRLIRRVFSLNQLHNGWATHDVKSETYSTLLNKVTVYTSLESCSQCSGIMALGSVKEVVFLQRDPTQNSIGNILRNLSKEGDKNRPPLPIPADAFGLGTVAELEARYRSFAEGVAANPFHKPPGGGEPDRSSSITSFLCTDLAFEVFARGKAQFEATREARYPEYRPPQVGDSKTAQETFTNARVVEHIHRFFAYATGSGRRGTPHTL